MCLDCIRKCIIDLFPKRNREIIAYKIVKVFNGHYKSGVMNVPIHLGRVNYSDRRIKNLTRLTRDEKRFGTIDHGIHVYLTLNGALNHFAAIYAYGQTNCHILRVICAREDYVAHNNTQAVFSKVKYHNAPIGQDEIIRILSKFYLDHQKDVT